MMMMMMMMISVNIHHVTTTTTRRLYCLSSFLWNRILIPASGGEDVLKGNFQSGHSNICSVNCFDHKQVDLQLVISYEDINLI